MRKGFLSGLLAGGVVTAMALYSMPKFKNRQMRMSILKRATDNFMDDTKDAGIKTRKIIRGARKMAKDWME